MAEEQVCCEPLSTGSSLIYGNLQGNLANYRLTACRGTPVTPYEFGASRDQIP
jgi:hypothetical protein